MLSEFLIAFGVIALSLAGLGIGLAFGRGAPRTTCAAAMTSAEGACPVCGRTPSETGERG